jgi:hypothetical protein
MNVASIKTVFGNHNDLQLFLEFINSTDGDVLPPTTVLYRTVDCNYPDAELVNAKLKHQALTRKFSRELIRKYPDYQEPL